MTNFNAAVYLLSSRKENLFTALKSFYKNWNSNFDYPVYIHYYDDIYDDEKFKKKFYDELSEKIHFCKIEYKLPEHIEEKELFYNRNYLNYVNSGRFTKNRIGYLHMCKFCSNLANFDNQNSPNPLLKKYDYLLKIDDDLFFQKKINFDLFKYSENYPLVSGSNWNVSKREIKNNPMHGNIETRENLFKFIKNYVNDNEFAVKNKQLAKSLVKNNEFLMHTLPWSRGLFIYNMQYFNTPQYRNYFNLIEEFGGIYKHRWGDIEITSLYTYIHLSKKVKFLNLEKKNIYDPKFITSFAPSTKN